MKIIIADIMPKYPIFAPISYNFLSRGVWFY